MPADEFQALVDDIEANGQRDPITIFSGEVLDGWHRYQACERLMLPVKADILPDTEDAVAWVISKNAKRRNLSASQRAMAVAECQQWAPTGRPQNPAPGAGFSPTSARMADQAGVSERTVRQAKAVVTSGAPEVKAAVKAGTVSVKKAAAVAALPLEKQVAALTEKPKPKPAPTTAPHKTPAKQEREQAADEGDPSCELDDLRASVHALSEQNQHLEARLAVEAMDATEEEKSAAAAMIDDLRAQVRTLTAAHDAVRSVRDSLLVENRELKSQVAYWRRRAEKAA